MDAPVPSDYARKEAYLFINRDYTHPTAAEYRSVQDGVTPPRMLGKILQKIFYPNYPSNYDGYTGSWAVDFVGPVLKLDKYDSRPVTILDIHSHQVWDAHLLEIRRKLTCSEPKAVLPVRFDLRLCYEKGMTLDGIKIGYDHKEVESMKFRLKCAVHYITQLFHQNEVLPKHAGMLYLKDIKPVGKSPAHEIVIYKKQDGVLYFMNSWPKSVETPFTFERILEDPEIYEGVQHKMFIASITVFYSRYDSRVPPYDNPINIPPAPVLFVPPVVALPRPDHIAINIPPD